MTKRLRTALLPALLVLLTALAACATTDEPPPELYNAYDGPIAGIHGNMSRIRYGANVAYIFGSMHLGRPHWFPLNERVEAAMAAADVFAFEFNLAEADDPALIFSALPYMILPGGQTWADFLPPDIYDSFLANLKTYDFFDPAMYQFLNILTPMAVTLDATGEISGLMDIDQDYSVDSYVHNFALANGRPVIGLNSALSELRIMLDVPDEVQIAAAAAFTDRETAMAASDDIQLADLYERQDMAAIRGLRLAMSLQVGDPYARHMYENVMLRRHNIFANEIARLLRETGEPTTFFITVGLLHITGGDLDANVLNLLRGMGFEVVELFN